MFRLTIPTLEACSEIGLAFPGLGLAIISRVIPALCHILYKKAFA